MKRFRAALILCATALASTLAPAQPAPMAAPQTAAAAPQAGPADSLLDAAARGETGPLTQVLADPATGRDLRVLARAALAASRLDQAAARDPALRRLAAGRDPMLRRAALRIVTGAAFAHGDYAEAARAGRLLAAALTAVGAREDAAAAAQVWRLAAMLARHGRPGVAGGVRAAVIAARRDRVGLTRIDLKVNGQSQEAVFDTGANLSVLSASTARRLGVAIEAGEGTVGNGVQSDVAIRVGVAARVEIGGTILTNVPFLIIDDTNLTFPQVPGGYSIPAILGVPEMRALGRLRMEQAGRLVILPPPEEGQLPAPNLHAGGSELFADVGVDGRLIPLHLDTGADRTGLTALYAEAEPGRIASLQTGSGNFASAGGTRARRFATWPDAPLALAGRAFTLPQLQIELPGDGPASRFNGVLGADVLRRFESYTLDFRAMRLSLGAPVAAPAR